MYLSSQMCLWSWFITCLFSHSWFLGSDGNYTSEMSEQYTHAGCNTYYIDQHPGSTKDLMSCKEQGIWPNTKMKIRLITSSNFFKKKTLSTCTTPLERPFSQVQQCFWVSLWTLMDVESWGWGHKNYLWILINFCNPLWDSSELLSSSCLQLFLPLYRGTRLNYQLWFCLQLPWMESAV